MNKYKIISIILSVVSLALLGGMLYLVYGKDSQEPKSKEVTTETTTTTSTTEETTTKVSEIQQLAPVQSSVVVPLAPPSTISSTAEVVQTRVILGKSYPVNPYTGRLASADEMEARERYEAFQKQNEVKQPTGLGGAGNPDWTTTVTNP